MCPATGSTNASPDTNRALKRPAVLTKMEEIELVRWIKQCTIVGYPVSYQMLREMAVEIQYKHVANINNQTIESVSYDPIGRDWIRRFIARHPQLEAPRGRRIEAA